MTKTQRNKATQQRRIAASNAQALAEMILSGHVVPSSLTTNAPVARNAIVNLIHTLTLLDALTKAQRPGALRALGFDAQLFLQAALHALQARASIKSERNKKLVR